MTISIDLIGILITVFLFLLVHIGTLVWFMSKVSSVTEFLRQDLNRLGKVLDRFEQERYTVRDSEKDWAHHREEHKTLWQRVDELKVARSA